VKVIRIAAGSDPEIEKLSTVVLAVGGTEVLYLH
jgi:hypothetical protein